MAPPQRRTAKKPTRAALTGEALLLDAEEEEEEFEDLSDAPLVCPRLVTLARYFAITKEEECVVYECNSSCRKEKAQRRRRR